MPTKLKVLLGLIGTSILMNVVGGIAGSSVSWVSALLNVILFIGVLKGSEGARTILMGMAALGLLFGGIGLLVSILALAASPILGLVLVIVTGFACAQNGYSLWCLQQYDVQKWMYDKSLLKVD